MRIPLDRHADAPLYQQIEDWLRREIISGDLAAHTRLPSTRALAEQLGVSRITVVNAYAALDGDGLIVTSEGSGTFVATAKAGGSQAAQANRPHPAGWPLWQHELAGSPPAEPDVLARPPGWHPDPISFTGVGDPRLFPVAELARTVREVLRRDGADALGYGPFDRGYEPLRTTVVRILASQGIRADREQVLITAGSQQALALVCQVLLGAGDTVLVEEPTYNLALDLFRAMKLKIVGVPVDADGMRVDLVEPLLQCHHPRLIYTIPNFQNPSGVCLSVARRRHLVDLAGQYNLPILEDDFAGDLRYEGRARPAIRAFDPGGRVLYAGTFSKLLTPGLRVGYLLADGPVLDRLALSKQVQDLTTAPLIQRVLDRYVTVGRYQSHLRRTARVYRQRRDALLAGLARELPELTVATPSGGLFAWVRLPEPVGCRDLLAAALAEGVEFAPGTRFFTDPARGQRYARLNFAAVTPDEIDQGIARLRRAVDSLRRSRTTAT